MKDDISTMKKAKQKNRNFLKGIASFETNEAHRPALGHEIAYKQLMIHTKNPRRQVHKLDATSASYISSKYFAIKRLYNITIGRVQGRIAWNKQRTE